MTVAGTLTQCCKMEWCEREREREGGMETDKGLREGQMDLTVTRAVK